MMWRSRANATGPDTATLTPVSPTGTLERIP